jgi:hypothetical protein
MNGLAVFDTDGRLQIAMGAHAISENGQAGLSLSAAEKDRHIKMAAKNDGRLTFMLTDKGTPMLALMLTEGERKELSSDLVLMDKEARSGVAVSSGRRSDPHLRLLDRRQKVRGSFELGVGGEPVLYFADEEGKPIDPRNAFERAVADRSLWYQAVFFVAVLIAGGIGGAWMANTASLSGESLPAAVITVVVLVAMAGLLFVAHRRGW